MKYIAQAAAAAALLAVLSSCATIVEGTGQSIAINTAPPGATCALDRMGIRLGEVANTPGSVQITKSKESILVTCVKAGYQSASIAQSPTFSGTTFGNVIAGGLIGAAVDASSGANFNYPPQVMLALAPVGPAAPQSPTYYYVPAAPGPRQPGM